MVLRSLLDLVFPVACFGCGRGGAAICQQCQVPSVPTYVSQHPPTVAATEYDGVIRSAVLAYKERGRRELSPMLGAYLGDALTFLVTTKKADVLVAVPSSQAAQRARGGAHLRPLARLASRRSRLPILEPLTFTRPVRDSAGMGALERAENLAVAMRATCPPRRGVRVVLLDDIVTTGATLREAERALLAAGWRVVGAAVIAATPRRRGTAAPFEIPRR